MSVYSGYYKGIGDLYRGEIDLLTDDIRCILLTNTYNPSLTDEFYSEVTAYEPSGYSGSVLLTNKTITSDTATKRSYFNADDITAWSTGSFSARYVVIYKDTGVASTSTLIALLDMGGTRSAPFVLNWNDSGIFSFSSSEDLLNALDFEGGIDPVPLLGQYWDEQVNPNIVPLTSDGFDSISSAWDDYNPCETASSPYGFDSVSDAGSQIDGIQSAIKKEGSYALKWIANGTTTQSWGIISVASQTTLIASLWVNFDGLNIESDGYFNFFQTGGTVTAQNLACILRIVRSSGNYILRAYTRLDSGSFLGNEQTLETYPITENKGWRHFWVSLRISSGAGNDDGYCIVVLDGETVQAHTDVDNDTFDVVDQYYGRGGSTVNVSGTMYMDEIYSDITGAPNTVAINQMQGREYSMGVPSIGGSPLGSLTLPVTRAQVFVEFDWKLVWAESGTTFPICRILDTSPAKNPVYLQYDVDNEQIRVVYDDDTSSDNVSSWVSMTGVTETTLCILWKASTAPGADDGYIRLFRDGIIVDSVTGMDTDTLTVDQVQYGYFYATNAICHYGTLRYTDTYGYTVKDWAALNGNYGLAQYRTSSGGGFIKPTTGYSLYTYQAQADYSNVTSSNGDNLVAMWFRDSSSGRPTGMVTIENVSGSYRLEAEYYSLSGLVSIGTYDLGSTENLHIKMVFQRSTDTLTSDGYFFVYVDGELVLYEDSLITFSFECDQLVFGGGADGLGGCLFFDDIDHATIAAFPNPFDASYFNSVYEYIIPFENDVIENLTETYFAFLSLSSLLYLPTVVEGKPEIVTPGMADYRVRVKNQQGELVAEFDNWRSVSLARSLNTLGSCRFEIDGNDSRTSLFELDSQIEVWRRNPNVGLDWVLEWEGLHRTYNDLIQVNGKRSFVSFSVGYLHLIKRKHILYFSESVQSSKNSLSGKAILDYVLENAGESALQSNGRIIDGVLPGLAVGADLGYGNAWEGSRAWKNLFSTVQTIAEGDNLYIDVIGIGPALFEFNVYETRGVDRSAQNVSLVTGKNSAGYSPMIFSTDYDNMELPNLAINRSNEINRGLALGQGVEDDRALALTQYVDKMNDSPWNAIEGTIQATSEGDSEEKLLIRAKEFVEENLYDRTLSFKVMQTEASYYGKHYNYGDVCTFKYADEEMHKTISGVKITVSENSSGEKIDIEVAENIYG